MTVGPPSKIKPFFLKTLALPPRSGCFYIIVTSWPLALSLRAAAIPPNPDPITIEFIFVIYSFFEKIVTVLWVNLF